MSGDLEHSQFICHIHVAKEVLTQRRKANALRRVTVDVTAATI
jgi:hypothetical protein